ncbi:MAG: hypothetical protein NC417_08125 [Candidatus Gastranaerophilales bacterium]|nr:hypothetical protein [Candidatus Gastranaerophilales bacterium]
MTAEEIMNSGKLYKVMELTDEQGHYHEYLQKMEEYNTAGYTPEGEEKKARILHEIFAEAGEGAYIQAPYHAMWGGGTSTWAKMYTSISTAHWWMMPISTLATVPCLPRMSQLWRHPIRFLRS